jgi:hypothetical protein
VKSLLCHSEQCDCRYFSDLNCGFIIHQKEKVIFVMPVPQGFAGFYGKNAWVIALKAVNHFKCTALFLCSFVYYQSKDSLYPN